MPVDDRGAIADPDRPSYLSFSQYDARQFDGAITRGLLGACLADVDSVWSAGAGAAELERDLAAATDWSIRAIDVDEAVVQAVQDRALPANLSVAVGDVRDPGRRESYDAVLAFGTVQELVGSPVDGLRGIHDALRPGGVALVAVPNLANVLRVAKPDYLHVDDSLEWDGRLAYAELRLTDGSAVEQYGFTHEGQSFTGLPTEGLDADPATLTPFESLIERAGLRPADPTPLAEWAATVDLESGGKQVDGLELDVGGRFPVAVPVDPSGLLGDATGTPLHEQVVSFDPATGEELAAAVRRRGLEAYRIAQARNAGLPPRVDMWALRRPG